VRDYLSQIVGNQRTAPGRARTCNPVIRSHILQLIRGGTSTRRDNAQTRLDAGGKGTSQGGRFETVYSALLERNLTVERRSRHRVSVKAVQYGNWAYTQQFVQQASQKYPGYNVVICHPKHRVSGANIHQHHELPMTVGTCGYDIYFSRKGKPFTFVNEGDGGFINWAFNGEFNRNGNTLVATQQA
jgi:hypothetical protein